LTDAFQLVAGHVALDFANTLDNRYDPARRIELLPTYERFLAFAREAGVLYAPSAETQGAAAAHALTRIIEMREAMHFLFLSVAAGDAPPSDALETFNVFLAEARATQTLEWERGQFGWRSQPSTSLLSPLYPIVFAAADLLISPDLAYVRECSAETCRWLFLDRSKNHSRRWCDMKACGNRAKAQRFQSRQG
jgi:predicted RNA-binding Zn ribbon-like protein